MAASLRFYPLWPYVVLSIASLAIIGAPAFARLDPSPREARGRLATLDGLRGFLALGVFFHHAAIYHEWQTRHVWTLPPSWFYAALGQVGVALFFMITGYLFWGKLIAEGARIDWLRLYVGRVFRLGPVYLLAVGGMVLALMIHADWQLHEPARVLAHHVARWLALGVLDGGGINADPLTGVVLAGVTWTLWYEWAFYASLPWLGVFVRGGWWHLGASAAALAWALTATQGVAGLLTPMQGAIVLLFAFGMVVASLHAGGLRARLPWGLGSALAFALIALAFALGPNIYAVRPIVALGGAFYLIASGASLFGLLFTRGAQRLGHISYGLYLLQGLALLAAFSIEPLPGFAQAGPRHHWAVVGLATVLLLLAAAAAHVAIERPGMALGRRVADLLLGRRRPPAPVGGHGGRPPQVGRRADADATVASP